MAIHLLPTRPHRSEVRRDLSALREAERDSALRTDTLTYQINEIESAQLQSAEEGELREAISEAVGVMPILLGHGDERAMTRLHTRNGQAESAEKAGAGSGPQQGE